MRHIQPVLTVLWVNKQGLVVKRQLPDYKDLCVCISS